MLVDVNAAGVDEALPIPDMPILSVNTEYELFISSNGLLGCYIIQPGGHLIASETAPIISHLP